MAGLFWTHDNYSEVENYWSQKYNEKKENKMKKCYHFFFLLK